MFELRPFQKEAMACLEKPGALICVAPTGSGKSLVFERIAQKPGTRMVLFTPLVALARQQRDRLLRAGIQARLGAGPESEQPPLGESGAWIISPEKLEFAAARSLLARWNPNFLVVDECHCLWDWGDRFRPAFREIPGWTKFYRPDRSLWLTATLPRSAREELKKELPSPVHEIGSFALPENLFLKAERCPFPDRVGRMLEWIDTRQSSGIIFVQTREGACRLTRLLLARGLRAVYYHAGMSTEERRTTEALIEKKLPHVIVATSAFGMGMDHPHLRWVLLWQAPPSLLSLAQAIGRAARSNEESSEALLLWDDDDFKLLQWITQGSDRSTEELRKVREFFTTLKCRRAALKTYFDGKETDLLCNLCDFCVEFLKK